MAYVPKDAEWFLAEFVEEFRVEGSKRNVVHINYILIHAHSPSVAYARAMAKGKSFGKNGVSKYLNPKGKMVTHRFRGLRNLDVIHDSLEDGCEIMYLEKLGVNEKGIKKMLRRKSDLEVFQPIGAPRGRPDFSSKEIVDMLIKRLRQRKKRKT